ncbi:MAG: DUF2202 domain-containing protein [Methanomicrobiales archaeon]|nr:DUF2202 domain-containing protein [Methanomicrobiales archaeon]
MKSFAAILILVLILLSAGCTSHPEPAPPDISEYLTPIDSGNLSRELGPVPAGMLTPAEEQDILFMQEEEKLARDVYAALYEKWQIRAFLNIGEAEQTHLDSMTVLVDRYQIESRISNERGVFSNETLRFLYDDLVARGSTSSEEALRVGALIEEIDIVDLQEAMTRTGRQDILQVYDNLAKGSRNHLRAFVNVMGQQGISYTPQVLPQDEYQAIIASSAERGRA